MSSQLHLGFLSCWLVFVNLLKDQESRRLVFDRLSCHYVAMNYFVYVIYHGMSSDHVRHALRDSRDYVHGELAWVFFSFDGRAHVNDYDCIYHHVYDGDVHVLFHGDDVRAISHEELHLHRFILCPYLDVRVLVR